MDISKAQFLKKKQFPFLSENANAIVDNDIIKTLKKSEGYSEMEEYKEKVITVLFWLKKTNDDICYITCQLKTMSKL